MKRFLLIALALCSLARADYKSGIDATPSGTQGTDFEYEYFYHDPLVSDRKVTYIKAATTITLSHNARNVARLNTPYYQIIGVNGADGIAASGDEGVIRYKFNGDMNWGPYWTAQASVGGTIRASNPIYTTPLSFATATYPVAQSSLTVLDRVGDNGGTLSSKSGYFHYGILGGVGDQWHTITVADDDVALTPAQNAGGTDNEWRASDGKVYLYVVNPKTPCFTATVTGTGQFYTTPPKSYFIPRIHEQTTYIRAGTSGTVSITLKDINGNNVFYRIGGSGAFTNAGSSSVTLTDSAFASGSNTLEYYYNGNVAFTKTRIVVKDPPFPSAGETHGFLSIGDATNYTAMLARRSIAPYAYHWSRLVSGASDSGRRTEWDNNRNLGRRFVPDAAYANALVAKINGITAVPSGKSRTFAEYAKEMLLQNSRTIDQVGFENDFPQVPGPTRELYYRGYNDVGTTIDQATGYDLLISIYKSTDHANGITPIEDYFMRDSIANNVHECLMFAGSWNGSVSVLNGGGMWDTARKCGGVLGVLALPSYSTPYYGTSGIDGNTTGYNWAPFPNIAITWKKAFLDNDQALAGYPDMAIRLGVEEYNYLPNGKFADKGDYLGLMGAPIGRLANALKYNYPSVSFPNFEAYHLALVNGTAMATKGDNNGNTGPYTRRFLFFGNANFSAIADVLVPYVTSFPLGTEPNADDQLINGTMPGTLSTYNVSYTPGSDVVAPTVLSATVNNLGNQVTVVFSETCRIGANGPSGLTITTAGVGAQAAIYADGDGTATWRFSLLSVVNGALAVTRTYATANGIEDASGNDLGAFTAATVINESTQSDAVVATPRIRVDSRYPKGSKPRR